MAAVGARWVRASDTDDAEGRADTRPIESAGHRPCRASSISCIVYNAGAAGTAWSNSTTCRIALFVADRLLVDHDVDRVDLRCAVDENSDGSDRRERQHVPALRRGQVLEPGSSIDHGHVGCPSARFLAPDDALCPGHEEGSLVPTKTTGRP